MLDLLPFFFSKYCKKKGASGSDGKCSICPGKVMMEKFRSLFIRSQYEIKVASCTYHNKQHRDSRAVALRYVHVFFQEYYQIFTMLIMSNTKPRLPFRGSYRCQTRRNYFTSHCRNYCNHIAKRGYYTVPRIDCL